MRAIFASPQLPIQKNISHSGEVFHLFPHGALIYLMPRSKSSAEYSGGKPKDRSNFKASTDQSAQQTISELFATSKHKFADQEAEDLTKSSPSKRLKRDHSSLAKDNAASSPRTMQQEGMYSSFPSTITRKPEVIEISDGDSPPKLSPLQSKPNRIVRPKNIAPQAGLKKLVVKNLRKTPRTDPDQYYSHVWNQLDSALSAIFDNEKVPCSMEELYRGVEILCRQDRAPSLYKKLCEKCKQASTRMEKPLMAALSSSNNVIVLRTAVGTWSAWTTQVVNVKSEMQSFANVSRPLSARYSSTWIARTSCIHHHCPQSRTWRLSNSAHKSSRMRPSNRVYCEGLVILLAWTGKGP